MTHSRLLPFSALLGLFASSVAWPSDAVRGGVWWQSAPEEEQLGYLEGYFDCAAYDAGLDTGILGWSTLAPMITAQYAKHPEKATQPVSAVLKELIRAEPRGPVKGGEGGQHNTEKHGFLDGEYWNHATSEHVNGFVAGYLDCWKTEGMRGARYSKPPAKYVALVSEWYDFDFDLPPAVAARHSKMKIADVLWMFRDK